MGWGLASLSFTLNPQGWKMNIDLRVYDEKWADNNSWHILSTCAIVIQKYILAVHFSLDMAYCLITMLFEIAIYYNAMHWLAMFWPFFHDAAAFFIATAVHLQCVLAQLLAGCWLLLTQESSWTYFRAGIKSWSWIEYLCTKMHYSRSLH